MKRIKEYLGGIQLIEPFVFSDARGCFVKPFHQKQLARLGIRMAVQEEFYSTSAYNVLRGMHFQAPPHAHSKLIYCTRGAILDVVVDLRRGSPTYGKVASFELSEENRRVVYIPVGFGHGFLSLADCSCLVYKTDSVYAPAYDFGVRWDSIDFNWPVAQPLLSSRDKEFPTLAGWLSPFVV